MKKLSRGMVKDTAVVDQPEGTMRDALNANLNVSKGSIVNEYGTSNYINNEDFVVYGRAVLDDDHVVLFGVYKVVVANTATYTEQIRLLNPRNNVVIVLYQDTSLNFKETHPIVCVTRKNQANEHIVYFTDGYKKEQEEYQGYSRVVENNPPRVINVTRQLEWRNAGGLVTQLYNTIDDYTKLDLVPRIGPHSTIDSVKIQEGGGLKSAAYYLCLSYADNNGLETNYFAVANPVYIVPGEENAIPTNSLIGAEGGTATNKSIAWQVTVPDDVSYNLIQPAVIRLINQEQTAFKLPPVKANAGGGVQIVYTGTEQSLPIAPEDILVDDVRYTSAEAIAQLDNRLYLGNVTASRDIGFQPFAHNIEVIAKHENVATFNPRVFDTYIVNYGYASMMQLFNSNVGRQFFEGWDYDATDGYTGQGSASWVAGYAEALKSIMTDAEGETLKGYRSPKYNFKKKSYRRGEVYAFYISFVLKDGTETYAYHIPGRTARALENLDTVNENFRLDAALPGEIKTGTGFRPEEFLASNPNAKVYQAVDTSQKVVDSETTTMAFWENENEFYPNTLDFVKGQVADDGSITYDLTSTLAGENVRHHRFPSNLGPQSFADRAVGSNPNYTEQIDQFNGAGSAFSNTSTTEGGGDGNGFVLGERIKLLGIEIKNLQLPKYILEQVQGFKIYYAKRTKDNKTVLGQGVAVPGHPRYATVNKQNVAEAVSGPFKRAFYMYGGLDHSDNSTVHTIGHWKGNGAITDKDYFAHPVFKFHDFNLLRNRDDLSAATHIQCQYGLIFRMFQGGPGNFVPPCDYEKLKDAPDKEEVLESGNYSVFNEVGRDEQHTTSFPSEGWVSPEMKNTVDFYWHDPLHVGSVSGQVNKELFGLTRILDISDVIEGEADAAGAEGDAKQSKRAKNFRKSDDVTQPAEDPEMGGNSASAERLLACEAKASRVRAWYTSMMFASTYIAPAQVLGNEYIIKGGAYKEMNPTSGSSFLTRFYSEGSFDDNQLTLNIEPGGRILLKGREDYESTDSASFKGANYLYNRAGETAHVLSLVSGLPALRGHLPFYANTPIIENPGVRVGLTTWGAANRWLYPDAAQSGVPVYFQQYGNGLGRTDHYQWVGGEGGSQDTSILPKYDPSKFTGLKYTMTLSNQFDGLPMAWLINVCAFRTDVYTPFDQQQLVWTGFYQRIESSNLANGAANDGAGNTQNYYTGTYQSGNIFGGDTYIVRHGVRISSQSYGHSFFRGAKDLNDPVADSLIYDNIGTGDEIDEGLGAYLNDAITTKKKRFQGDIPTNLDPTKRGSDQSTRFGTTDGNPVWNWAKTAAGDASNADDYTAAKRTLQVLRDSWNWEKGNVNPVSTLLYFYCESDDLIEFRHVKDVEKGQETRMFDYHTASSMIFDPPTSDYTHPDKILYSEHFSAVQDLKVAQPLPVFAELVKESTFPRRIVRSDIDSGSLADGYRKFRALNYKDIPSQRGDIKSLFDYRGVLYIHTDRSLFLTQGKEELQIGAANAFIGSGDIFRQDPSEVQETTVGYGGTSSRHCNVTTKHGHFYLNHRDRKVYLAGGQGIQDVSPGMETWLRENMPFTLEQYGINLESSDAEANGFFTDAPTARAVPIGFTMGYDPVFDRVLITKREPVPTQAFLDAFNAGEIVISNNTPTLIDTGDGNCISPEENQEDQGGEVDLSRQKDKEDEGEVGEAVEIFCGPLSYGNPKYFKQGGWTVSYYPSAKVWGSRHSYLPNLYTHTSEHMLSFGKGLNGAGDEIWGSWEHSNKKNPGRFYGRVYNFEVEYIDNTAQAEAKLYSTINYWAESFMADTKNVTESLRITNPVFDKYYAYNSTQITGEPTTINYLNNARLVDRIWHINELRDYAKTEVIRDGELITGTENVAGYITSSVTSHIQTETMFEEEGVVNSNYVDTSKEWYNRRKLVDHFLGVRLIHDNSNRNLVHLYAVGTKFRKSYR